MQFIHLDIRCPLCSLSKAIVGLLLWLFCVVGRFVVPKDCQLG